MYYETWQNFAMDVVDLKKKKEKAIATG